MPGNEEFQSLLEKLKAQTELLSAQAAALNAEKARLDAAVALAKVSDPTQATVDRANADKAIAEAVRDKYRALLPQTTALEGTTTLDSKVLIESELLVYGKVEKIAKRIAERLIALGATPLIVYGDAELYALLGHGHFVGWARLLQAEYERIIASKGPDQAGGVRPTMIPSAAAAIAGVSAAIDLLGLLRQNVAITGTEFTVAETALVAAVSAKLGDQIVIKYPAILPELSDPLVSEVVTKLKELGDAKRDAHQHLGPEKKDQPDPRHAELKEIDTLYMAMLASLGKVDDKGIGALSGLLHGEALATSLASTARMLVLRTISARGSNRARQSRVPWGGRVDHSGGAIVMYLVLDKEGAVKASGVEKGYTGFVQADEDREGEKFPE